MQLLLHILVKLYAEKFFFTKMGKKIIYKNKNKKYIKYKILSLKSHQKIIKKSICGKLKIYIKDNLCPGMYIGGENENNIYASSNKKLIHGK